jgi:hypothetical protein
MNIKIQARRLVRIKIANLVQTTKLNRKHKWYYENTECSCGFFCVYGVCYEENLFHSIFLVINLSFALPVFAHFKMIVPSGSMVQRDKRTFKLLYRSRYKNSCYRFLVMRRDEMRKLD